MHLQYEIYVKHVVKENSSVHIKLHIKKNIMTANTAHTIHCMYYPIYFLPPTIAPFCSY